jgi:hypothetical protein
MGWFDVVNIRRKGHILDYSRNWIRASTITTPTVLSVPAPSTATYIPTRTVGGFLVEGSTRTVGGFLVEGITPQSGRNRTNSAKSRLPVQDYH